MVDVVFLSTFWDVIWSSFIVFFVVIPLIMLWVFALVDLFVRPDIRWRKVLWLIFIVFVPIFGSIIYLLVRPQEADIAPYQEPASDA
ncbi:MAG: PLDc_N domain-containing protein [Chloroflexi bacterium]|nr:PLDc_N domain-containing protein [Chloroflexota bacterium]